MSKTSDQPAADTIELFVREYLVDLDKVRAYRVAHPGVSDATVHSASTRYLRRPDVRKRLAVQAADLFAPLEVNAETVVQELAALGFSTMADYIRVQPDGTAVIDLAGLTERQLAAIQEVTVDEYVEGKGEGARNVKRVKLRLVDKGQNLERLGRYLKLFTDVVEHKGLEALAERIKTARTRAARQDDHSDLA